MLEISSFYTPIKTTIICGMVPEIQSKTDRTFYHFGPFFAPTNPGNQNFEKMKEVSGDVIISNMCTTNHDHIIIYAS